MKELLLVCTTETPFKTPTGDIYTQVDGVAMGSPLGPLFANFYMANLETIVLENMPEAVGMLMIFFLCVIILR